MQGVLLCLDSGTTAVKAAAFDREGRMLAMAERANSALHRVGARVEQDMPATLADALAVLADCARQVAGPVDGLVLTGQGDGLWPVDAGGTPVGRAITWLDGRARRIVAQTGPHLDAVQAVTGIRPTAASASLHLLWLQQHDPDRLARIAHALRLKEWLFLSLTGVLMGEPTAALPVWGRWRSGAMAPEVPEILGLSRGLDLLPPFCAVGDARAGLLPDRAAVLGLPSGLPVLLGPGDVQSTLVGLGLGAGAGVARASVFGTSAIHACITPDPDAMPVVPPGAMVQPAVLGGGFLCFHPAFNGATLLRHLSDRFADLPSAPAPAWSGLIVHPFLEPGGERAPWTDPQAAGALIGLTAATTPAQIAWAGREALAFVAATSHAMMGPATGALALGGGLARDRHFARFLATATGLAVQSTPGAQAGLHGLAAMGARFLWEEAALDRWTCAPEETALPVTGPVADYAATKLALFRNLVETLMPQWQGLASLRAQADLLNGDA